MSDSKRREPRLQATGEAWLESLADAQYVSEIGRRFPCTVLEISSGGLRLGGIPVALAEDAILRIALTVAGSDDRFELTGCVRWCRAAEEGSYQVGWLLYDAQYTDYERWAELCKQLM